MSVPYCFAAVCDDGEGQHTGEVVVEVMVVVARVGGGRGCESECVDGGCCKDVWSSYK